MLISKNEMKGSEGGVDRVYTIDNFINHLRVGEMR
jgi:hypothetical protein